MAITAALLGNLLADKASLAFYEMQEIWWSHKLEANTEKMEKQMQYEGKFNDAFDDAQNCDTKIDFKGFHKEKGEVWSDEMADKYAHAKVSLYDRDLSIKYFEFDVEYTAMKEMYEALTTKLRADIDSEKQAVSTAAQDTGLIQGG